LWWCGKGLLLESLGIWEATLEGGYLSGWLNCELNIWLIVRNWMITLRSLTIIMLLLALLILKVLLLWIHSSNHPKLINLILWLLLLLHHKLLLNTAETLVLLSEEWLTRSYKLSGTPLMLLFVHLGTESISHFIWIIAVLNLRVNLLRWS